MDTMGPAPGRQDRTAKSIKATAREIKITRKDRPRSDLDSNKDLRLLGNTQQRHITNCATGPITSQQQKGFESVTPHPGIEPGYPPKRLLSKDRKRVHTLRHGTIAKSQAISCEKGKGSGKFPEHESNVQPRKDKGNTRTRYQPLREVDYNQYSKRSDHAPKKESNKGRGRAAKYRTDQEKQGWDARKRAPEEVTNAGRKRYAAPDALCCARQAGGHTAPFTPQHTRSLRARDSGEAKLELYGSRCAPTPSGHVLRVENTMKGRVKDHSNGRTRKPPNYRRQGTTGREKEGPTRSEKTRFRASTAAEFLQERSQCRAPWRRDPQRRDPPSHDLRGRRLEKINIAALRARDHATRNEKYATRATFDASGRTLAPDLGKLVKYGISEFSRSNLDQNIQNSYPERAKP
ncbi:hypothetical protein DFH06DRAFT_1149468 [Mycena polygramma]|nr:hypothetical protein DFH06DRAFT_1149468 [Mycena polygramma]